MKRALIQFSKAAQHYSRCVTAALKVQAATRGWLARREAAALRAELARQAAARAAEEAAARAIIAPWHATFRDRSHFLALRYHYPSITSRCSLDM